MHPGDLAGGFSLVSPLHLRDQHVDGDHATKIIINYNNNHKRM